MKRLKMTPDDERTPLLGGATHSACHPDPMSSSPGELRAREEEESKRDGHTATHTSDQQVPSSATVVSPPSSFTRLTRLIKKVMSEVTLEPMLFLKMVAEGNIKVVADTLEIDRICRVNLNFTESDCQAMDDGSHENVQIAVQRAENIFNYYQGLMDSILPLLVVAFAGSCSDRHGRKPPMLAVLAGFVAFSFMYLLTALQPSWPVQVLLAATLCVDMMGSWVVFNMAVYSYVADITTPQTRTRRLSILDACWYMGDPLGRLLGGWLYQASGYTGVFLVSGVLYVVCFAYLLFLVPESVKEETPTGTRAQSRLGPLQHVVALGRTAWMARAGRGRLHLLILIVVKLLVFLCQGHQLYLWARRVLRWGPTEFLVWTSLDSVVHQVGMVAWVWLAERTGLSDALVAVGGLASLALWSAVLACATRPWVWWLTAVATVLGSLEASIEPALRTLLTIVAGPGQAGKVLALTGFMEAAFFTVDSSLYTYLYNTYVDILPQINFLVQASWCLLLMVVLLGLKSDMHRTARPASPQHPQTNSLDQSTAEVEDSCEADVDAKDSDHAHKL